MNSRSSSPPETDILKIIMHGLMPGTPLPLPLIRSELTSRFIFLYLFEKEESMKYIIRMVFERLKSWCEMHPGDISGWTFFLWFLGDERPWKGRLEECGVRKGDVVGQVIEGMGIRRGHEAQWAFVRGVVIGMEGV